MVSSAGPAAESTLAARAIRAHSNAVENLVIFAPLALAVHATGSGTLLTALACQIYFFARLIHFLVCVVGQPIIPRTIAFLVGVVSQITLAAILAGLNI